MDDLSGHIAKGYELQNRIGVGGFGAVYRAYQSTVGREVAIKVILPEYANHPDFIRRFETEAQLVARLEHPFIVPLFDYWRDSNGAYLVMRYFREGNLRDRLDEGHYYEPEEAVRLVEQISGALAVAHRNGVIHRDLKPDNILLDDDGNAYLTDFGIAKVKKQDDNEEDEGISGSPGYMSPEQIINNPVTPQTDIYSLGIVIYEITTGRHPFSGSSTTELIMRHLQEPLPNIDPDENLPPSLNDVIQRATSKDPQSRFPDVLELAKAFKSAVVEDFEADTVVVEENLSMIVNPYKGLRPFEEADASDFFGREALIQQLLGRLSEQSDVSRFLAVVGPSGSGKSSVVKAGLLPALRWGDVAGSEDWFIVQMKPGMNPINNLETELQSVALAQVDDLQTLLMQDDRGLLNAAAAIFPSGEELLLVIDQFEEVFTLLESEQQRTHFLSMIRTAVMSPESRVRVIVTLRADFYDRPLLYEGFGTLMRLRTEVVLPLSSAELEKAITGPAERVGLIVESDFLAAVVADVREEPGALPLLQYVLTEVFERRSGRMLTLKGYQASGGALGALARRADELYNELNPKSQDITRQVFLRLVTLGEGTEDTRRRVQWAELTSFGILRDDLQKVLDAFGKYRLLSFDRDPQTREPTIEVAHEALIREWQLLREWLSASRDDVRLQRNLSASAMEWMNAGRDLSFLLRGNRLSQFEEWAEETDLVLTDGEREYLSASIARREARQAEEEARLAREAQLERTSRARLRVLVAVLSIAFIGAVVLTVFAFDQSQQAQTERDNAQSERARAETAAVIAQEQELIAQNEAAIAQSLAQAASAQQLNSDGNDGLALLLALEANSIDNPPAQVQRVLADVAYSPGIVRSVGPEDIVLSATVNISDVAYHPDGRHVLVALTNNTLALWDIETNEQVRTYEGHTLFVTSVAFDQTGTRALSGSWDSQVILWDVETGDILTTFVGHNEVVNDVALSADGTLAASAAGDGVIIWNVASGTETLRLGTDLNNMLSVAISPDGSTVVAGDEEGTVNWWNVETGVIIRRFFGQTQEILSVAFSPDGSQVVSSSRDSSIILRDLESGTVLQRFGQDAENGHELSVNSVAFNAQGTQIAAASEDTSLTLWNVETGALIRRFSQHSASVSSVAFSPDGSHFVSGSEGYSLILWSVGESQIARTYDGHDTSANDVSYNSDGTKAVSGTSDDRIIVWDVATGDMLLTIENAHTDSVTTVAFHPNDTQILSGSADQTAILWDAETGEQVRVYRGHEDAITEVKFNSDGSQFVSASDDETLIIWDVATGGQVHTLMGHTNRVLSVAFNPNGETIASGGADRTILLWDVETGELLQTLEGESRRITSLDYSPTENVLLSGSDNGDVVLWDIAAGQILRSYDTTSESENRAVLSVDFSPNGTTIIAGFEDGQVFIWETSAEFPIRRFEAITEGVGISTIVFSPDGENALSTLRDGRLLLWRTPSLEGLIQWAQENRSTPELTCAEREQYRVEPLCEVDRVAIEATEEAP